MIIKMEPGSDPSRIENVVSVLRGKDFDVQVASGNGQVLIAAFGQGLKGTRPDIMKLPGVKTIDPSNDFLFENQELFVDAW